MTRQEIINDIIYIVGHTILKTQSFTINKALKTFKSTRLNQSASQYTKLALVQLHRDYASLCSTLDAEKYQPEIEWLNNRAKEIEKSDL